MKQSIFTILSNTPLTDSVYKMVLSGDTSAITAPGQFVNIQLDGLFLRRPISVCDYDREILTIIYKVVGKGTEVMSAMTPGESLDMPGYPHRPWQRLRPVHYGAASRALRRRCGCAPHV